MVLNFGSRKMNTYLYPIRNGYVMIDTGSKNDLRSVLKRMDISHIGFNEVKYVFLTHAHDDHAGFLKELLIKYPHIRVVCHKKAKDVLLAGQNSFKGGCSGLWAYLFMLGQKLIGNGGHHFPKIDSFLLERFIFVDEADKSEAEDLLQGEIIMTPGHTADSISLRIGSNVFCGDMAMNGLPSRNRVNIWIEDRVQLLSSWERIIRLEPTLIYPAHGKPFSYLDLVKNKDYINNVRMYGLKE